MGLPYTAHLLVTSLYCTKDANHLTSYTAHLLVTALYCTKDANPLTALYCTFITHCPILHEGCQPPHCPILHIYHSLPYTARRMPTPSLPYAAHLSLTAICCTKDANPLTALYCRFFSHCPILHKGCQPLLTA